MNVESLYISSKARSYTLVAIAASPDHRCMGSGPSSLASQKAHSTFVTIMGQWRSGIPQERTVRSVVYAMAIC